MKKKHALPLIIGSSVLAAILITVIVMCAVILRPLSTFSDYKYVDVYASGIEGTLPSIADDKENKDAFDKAVKDSGFSAMHAFLEWQFFYGFKFQTTTDEDKNTVNVVVKGSEIQSKTVATADSYVVELVFRNNSSEPLKTMNVHGKEISYDRVRFAVKNTEGQLKEVVLYPYIYDLTYGTSEEVERYEITPVVFKTNTSPLFNSLKEIVDSYSK